jgi:hypothetical protein
MLRQSGSTKSRAISILRKTVRQQLRDSTFEQHQQDKYPRFSPRKPSLEQHHLADLGVAGGGP